MNILIVSPYYEPDFGPSSPLISSLSEDLVKLGHQVFVISTVPHYPTGYVPQAYRKKYVQWDNKGFLRICRVRIPSGNRANLFHRSLVFIIYQLIATIVGCQINANATIITNPALETFLPFLFLRKFRKNQIIYCVWDLYPDIGIHAGIFKSSIIIKFVDRIEGFCLKTSSFIQVFSQAFVRRLEKKGIETNKIIIIEPWIADHYFKEVPKDNTFSMEYGLNEKFIIMHAGNIGYSQDLEKLILAANLLRYIPSLLFVIVGDGPSRKALTQFEKRINPGNVLFIPYQEKDRIPEVYASADISIISQKLNLGTDSLPSKFLHILASKRPVIAITDPESSIDEIIKNSKAGVCIRPGDEFSLAKAIEELFNNPILRDDFSNNGYNYALANFHQTYASRAFEQLLLSLSG